MNECRLVSASGVMSDMSLVVEGSQMSEGSASCRAVPPGHSPGHMCFWDAETGYLFTGDLVYKGTLTAWFPSTDPEAYLNSLEQVAELPVKRVFPAHHALDIRPQILCQMRDAFRKLNEEGNLRHGCGKVLVILTGT